MPDLVTPPRVSAVITTYNYERYVAAAIESVLGQTVPPDEVVVVDDGSTDGTAAVVAGYTGRGVRYIRQANAGAGAARNRGIRETRGELIAFLDADDCWLPDKLERQLAHLRCYPAVGLVTGDEWQVFGADRPPVREYRRPAHAARLYPRILIENLVGNPSLVLVRRACFAQVGEFDETLPLGQDWEMWIRIARAYPIGVIDVPLIEFLQHDGSLTAGKAGARHRSNQTIRRRYLGAVQSPAQRAYLWCAGQSMSYFYMGAALADQGAARGATLRAALPALALDPGYRTKEKVGLVVRAVLGPAGFARTRSALRRVRQGLRSLHREDAKDAKMV
jgi:glycosyltransferase involved in cell wall biosynthesis